MEWKYLTATLSVFDKKQNEFVLGFGAEHPTSYIEDKLLKGYPDALLADGFVSLYCYIVTFFNFKNRLIF